MFSVIIPTFNNLNYLKLCTKSLIKNSKYKHELIFHVNEGSDGTLNYIKDNNLKHTFSKINSGVCVAYNEAVKLSTMEYIFLVMTICTSVLTGILHLLMKLIPYQKIKTFFYLEPWFSLLNHI